MGIEFFCQPVNETLEVVILFLTIQPQTLALAALVLGPGLVCTFLVLPVANYHNILCILQNIYNFYFVDKNNLRWKGWCASDEYK